MRVPEPTTESPLLAFEEFVVDPRQRVLRHQGRKIPLQDKPFDLLLALLESGGELVRREDLYERLWPESEYLDFEAGLNAVVSKLRRALGDDALSPRFLETVPGKGYRFLVAPTPHPGPEISSGSKPTWWRMVAVGLLIVSAAVSFLVFTGRAERTSSPLAARLETPLRVGIMPLGRGLEGAAAEPWDRLGEELLVALATGDYEVLGPRWTVHYSGMPFPDLVRIREELDLDYLLNGRPLPEGSGFILELIRLGDGAHPWVEILEAPAPAAVGESLRRALEAERSRS